jgi:hypothetical protein
MKRRKNPGWFRRGHDPRRHVFTDAERRHGGRSSFRSLTGRKNRAA